jgi:hypothetical protein
MSLEVEAFEGELKALRRIYKSYIHIMAPHNPVPNAYFICGELGAKDNNNMPDKLMVCPAYGTDFFYVYERTGETAGTEW